MRRKKVVMHPSIATPAAIRTFTSACIDRLYTAEKTLRAIEAAPIGDEPERNDSSKASANPFAASIFTANETEDTTL
jgi:hypothetical protein